MGAHEHRSSAGNVSVHATILVVSSSRTLETDTGGRAAAALLEGAGHRVVDRQIVPDDQAAIEAAIQKASGNSGLVLLTGGTGISARDVTPEAVASSCDRLLPGFGEVFRMLSYHDIGAAAWLSRSVAGARGRSLVVAVPGSEAGCRLAVEKVLLPELAHVVAELAKETPKAKAAPSGAAKKDEKLAPTKKVEEAPTLPPPTGSLGRLGKTGLGMEISGSEVVQPPPSEEGLPTSWKRAIYELDGTFEVGGWPSLPEELERIAPVVDVLHRAGKRGTLKLPKGRTYALFGFPDLESPASRVLAIGMGEPIGEVIALHRYPVRTGTTIDNGGLVAPRLGAAATAEQVTGRAPPDTSGELLAVQSDAVWIQRGSRAFRWDGTKERDEGTVKQVLASLVLDWSQR